MVLKISVYHKLVVRDFAIYITTTKNTKDNNGLTGKPPQIQNVGKYKQGLRKLEA